MTVYLPPRAKTWRYDFDWKGERYSGSTQQLTKEAAELVEREIRLKLRHEAGGIVQFFPEETPRIQDFAEIFLAYKKKKLGAPQHVEDLTRVLLRFFGARPADPTKVVEGEPYHDLRLGDLIARPDWILEFETWLARRAMGAQSRNHYRGMMRRLYTLALRPEYRKATGITSNPFLGVEHDQTFGRTVALTTAQVRRWLAAASYHVRLAIAIAALAPKLRLANVLALKWSENFQPDPRTTKFNPRVAHYITVTHHKTRHRTGLPLVTPVNLQLLRILKDAWRRRPDLEGVVTYRGVQVRSIRGGVKAAAEECGLPYGRDTADGATFHTLRHTATTLLSGVEPDPLKLKDAIGHEDLATTLIYRHMQPQHERPAMERLSRTLKIADVVTTPQMRATRTKPAPVLGNTASEVPGKVLEPLAKIREIRPKNARVSRLRKRA